MRITDIPCTNRPRERLSSFGASALSDAELLALVLQKGIAGENVVDMSNRLLARYPLDELSTCSVTELTSLAGIGKAKAMQIMALCEISKRMRGGVIREKVVRNAADVATHYMEKLRDQKKEHFIAVFLDSKNRIIADTVVSVGTLNASLVHPREVFKEAIKCSANAVILVHNHPSGDCSPSDEDMQITAQMRAAAELLNLRMLDHLIIGSGRWKSI
jgi:DNA repair protein RadC